MPTSLLLGDSSLTSTLTTFGVIALAELGDKSQLVCMTLAARYHARPVAIGAIAAFALLNALAVLFGAAVAAWLPPWLVTLLVAVLFALFGIAALRHQEEDETDETQAPPRYGIVATTFALIFVAEFGDKTQLAVAGLGSTAAAPWVWLGATLALSCTSLLGIYAGRHLLQRLPMGWLHRASGMLFLLLAAAALWQLLQA
ncbi:MAG: TMEM165/GDT1 family protein [Dechloromonas sp.]|nr:TMEM165/GDT1 family protein [Dechloromonas sp.]